MIKHRLLEIQKQLAEHNINASYDEYDSSKPYNEMEPGDYSLEWWGHDGSLCAINEWDAGDIIFYKNINGNRLIFHTVTTIEDFENYWATFPIP